MPVKVYIVDESTIFSTVKKRNPFGARILMLPRRCYSLSALLERRMILASRLLREPRSLGVSEVSSAPMDTTHWEQDKTGLEVTNVGDCG